MKDHYLEHLELVEAWKDEVKSAKKNKKREEDEKPKARLTPDVVDNNAAGLRIADKSTGEEFTIASANDHEMVLKDPVGSAHKLPKSSVSRFELD